MKEEKKERNSCAIVRVIRLDEIVFLFFLEINRKISKKWKKVNNSPNQSESGNKGEWKIFRTNGLIF
jgi:hypothetical protein